MLKIYIPIEIDVARPLQTLGTTHARAARTKFRRKKMKNYIFKWILIFKITISFWPYLSPFYTSNSVLLQIKKGSNASSVKGRLSGTVLTVYHNNLNCNALKIPLLCAPEQCFYVQIIYSWNYSKNATKIRQFCSLLTFS